MAYEDIKKVVGHEPVSFIEMDFDACSLTYGTAPCTASGSGDGKCFNSYATCQDKPNYDRVTKTFRFSSVRIDEIQASDDVPTFPTLTGLSMSPTSLAPGEGLGIRASCNITLNDHPYSFVGIDKYLTERTYNHSDRGTFWSRLITMFPYYIGKEVRVYTGFLNEDGSYDPSNFRSRTYFIESVVGPSQNGQIAIKCKDILRFGDREKATVPTQSRAVLVSDITDVQTSFDIDDPNDDVKGAYDAGQNYIRIDDETMLVNSLTGSAGAYTLGVTRAAMPSFYKGLMSAETHSSDSTVQHCHLFNQETPDDIIYYLLNTGAGIDPSFLPDTEWEDVINFGLQNYEMSCLLSEPEGIKDLLDEIAQHSIMTWWDERGSKVKLGSIIKNDSSFGPFNDEDNIVLDSVAVNRDDKARVSQTWIGFGHLTPVAQLDEPKNFSSYFISADADKEPGGNEYNQARFRRIFSRWLPIDKRTIASEITNRHLNYYKDTKNIISMDLDPKDDEAWTGDFVTVKTRLVQDNNGNTPERSYRVLESNEITQKGTTRYRYKLQSQGSFFDGNASIYGLIGPDTLVDYSDDTEANKSRYGYIAYDDRGDGNPGFPVGIDAYKVL